MISLSITEGLHQVEWFLFVFSHIAKLTLHFYVLLTLIDDYLNEAHHAYDDHFTFLQASFTLKQCTYNAWNIHKDFLKRPKKLNLNCIVKLELEIEHFLMEAKYFRNHFPTKTTMTTPDLLKTQISQYLFRKTHFMFTLN